MSKPIPSKGGSLPVEVIQLILAKCNHNPTLYAFARTSRASYSLAIPLLYKHITISSLRQLGRFQTCMHTQRVHAERPGSLHTASFTLAIAISVSSGLPLAARVSETIARQLVQALIDIPDTSPKGGPLFPKLTKAFLYPLCEFTIANARTRIKDAPRSTFLSNINHLELIDGGQTSPFDIPTCRQLGIFSLRHVHLHRVSVMTISLRAETAPEGFWLFAGVQPALESIGIHIQSSGSPLQGPITRSTVAASIYSIADRALVAGFLKRMCQSIPYSSGGIPEHDGSLRHTFSWSEMPNFRYFIVSYPTIGADEIAAMHRLRGVLETTRNARLARYILQSAPDVIVKWKSSLEGNEEQPWQAVLPTDSEKPWQVMQCSD